jgi:hypothetical protein
MRGLDVVVEIKIVTFYRLTGNNTIRTNRQHRLSRTISPGVHRNYSARRSHSISDPEKLMKSSDYMGERGDTGAPANSSPNAMTAGMLSTSLGLRHN